MFCTLTTTADVAFEEENTVTVLPDPEGVLTELHAGGPEEVGVIGLLY